MAAKKRRQENKYSDTEKDSKRMCEVHGAAGFRLHNDEEYELSSLAIIRPLGLNPTLAGVIQRDTFLTSIYTFTTLSTKASNPRESHQKDVGKHTAREDGDQGPREIVH